MTTKFINNLLATASNYVEKFEYTLGGVLHGFFDVLRQKQQNNIDFSFISDSDYLQQLKGLLLSYRENASHKYKKLHYTYLISKIDDRMFELEQKWSSLSVLDKVNHVLQSGDIILISYYSPWFSFDGLLNNLVSNALRLASHSLFAHVWLVGTLISDDAWRRRIHSTLHNDDGRRWVKKIPLNTYLESNVPADILVVRYTGNDTDVVSRMVEYGNTLAAQKIWYDTWDAVEDITWTSYFRKDDKFNCAEFVYSCLKSISPSFAIDKKWLPASFVDNRLLQQVYLTRVQ